MCTRLLYETENKVSRTFLAEHGKLNVTPHPIFSTFYVRCVGACSLKIDLEIYKMKYYKTISVMFCVHIKQ